MRDDRPDHVGTGLLRSRGRLVEVVSDDGDGDDTYSGGAGTDLADYATDSEALSMVEPARVIECSLQRVLPERPGADHAREVPPVLHQQLDGDVALNQVIVAAAPSG